MLPGSTNVFSTVYVLLLAGARQQECYLLPIPAFLCWTACGWSVDTITSILYDRSTENASNEHYDRIRKELGTVDFWMFKSNKQNDVKDATNDTIESRSNEFLHLAKFLGDRHCHKVIDLLLEEPIDSVRCSESVENVQGMRKNKSRQREEKWSRKASKLNCISKLYIENGSALLFLTAPCAEIMASNFRHAFNQPTNSSSRKQATHSSHESGIWLGGMPSRWGVYQKSWK